MSFFPLMTVAGATAAVLWGMWFRDPYALFALVAWLYLLPLTAFRIHQVFCPIKMGGSNLVGKAYSGWFGGHHIQSIYLYLPSLERLIRLVPGLFSLWLRLWGSKIGKRVYWTPHFEISDRSLLVVGDDVLFGHRVIVVSHLIKPTRKNLLLYVKGIEISSGAFIGAGTVIGPGVTVAEGTFVAIGSELYPGTEVS